MSDKEIQTVKMAAYYQLRLILANGDKENYTKEEVMELIDKLAQAKDQEH